MGSVIRAGNRIGIDGELAVATCDILRHRRLNCELAKMTRMLSSLRELRSSLGFGNALLYGMSRAVARTTGGRCRLIKYYFVAQPIPSLQAPARPTASKTRIYRTTPPDGIIAQFPRPPHVIAKRFADGAQCFVAEQAGQLVGFLWIKQERYDEDEVRCCYLLHPPDRLVWDFDGYVAPQFRMSRAFSRLWKATNEYLCERGYEWSISRISAFNAWSLASHRRLGIVHLHTATFLIVGPLQLSMFSRAPFLHVGFGPASAPRRDFHAPANRSAA
jgi:hypothetical protein